VITVGLTGGIGSGKSTVAGMLAERGARLIDADELAREVVEPGTDGLARVVERFGSEVLLAGGGLDRSKLASIVFADEAARADLNAIIHPAVASLMAERLESLAGTGHIVVLEIPLLAEGGGKDRYSLAGVLVVDTPVDLAIDRLVTTRRMDPADAERRIRAQASRAERLGQADFVILNTGTLEELGAMVDRAWAWMRTLVPNTS
jgi:dephospho-CoA kinase